MENYLKKIVSDYSLGMKQHLLLAMAIMNRPQLLFLDEPLNGLDPTSAILMRKILLELEQDGTTILLSSHNLAEIDKLTKNILFLKEGKLIEVDMSVYNKIYYSFELSDRTRAIELLNEKSYHATPIENGLKVEMDKHSLDTVIDLIKTNQIQILDIQKEVTGSENLYEEIFGL